MCLGTQKLKRWIWRGSCLNKYVIRQIWIRFQRLHHTWKCLCCSWKKKSRSFVAWLVTSLPLLSWFKSLEETWCQTTKMVWNRSTFQFPCHSNCRSRQHYLFEVLTVKIDYPSCLFWFLPPFPGNCWAERLKQSKQAECWVVLIFSVSAFSKFNIYCQRRQRRWRSSIQKKT